MELHFNFLQGEGEKIIGFSLEAGGETYSERFCKALGDALATGDIRGSVEINLPIEGREAEIVFSQSGETHTVAVDKRSAAALKLLLEVPEELGIYPEPHNLGVGLRVMLITEKDARLLKV